MCIKGVPPLEPVEKVVEALLTLGVWKPVPDQEVDKDDWGRCPYLVDGSTLVSGFYRVQVFSGSMGDHFLSGRIVLRSRISIGISNSPCVMSGLIVKAFSIKPE